MGVYEFQARILAAAMSHPLCGCPGLWAKAATLKIKLAWPQYGGLYIDEHEFNVYNGQFGGSEWPPVHDVTAAFRFRD